MHELRCQMLSKSLTKLEDHIETILFKWGFYGLFALL